MPDVTDGRHSRLCYETLFTAFRRAAPGRIPPHLSTGNDDEVIQQEAHCLRARLA